MKMCKIFSLVGVVMLVGCKQQPVTYEQCILNAIQANLDPTLIKVVQDACKMQKVRSGILDPRFSQLELSKVNGSLWHSRESKNSYLGNLSVRFYNSNPNLFITSVDVRVNYSLGKLLNNERKEGLEEIASLNVSIPPYGTQDIQFDTSESDMLNFEFDSWNIVSARGIRLIEPNAIK